MQNIPVIDIRNGIAVRAVAGDRSRYRAIDSLLTCSAEPAQVLRAIREHFQLAACYVADLDAIEGRQLNRCTIAEMVRTGVSLIVDAGVTTVEQIEAMFEIGVNQVVLSSESMKDMTQLEPLIRQFNPASLFFSIDLRHGELLVKDPAWQGKSPLDLATFVIQQGIRQLIVLDLAAVGTGRGVPTLQLCRDIRRFSQEVKIISGGGVTSKTCVTEAAQAGLDGLLIASALHDGRLKMDDFSQLIFVYGSLKRGHALHALLQGQLYLGDAVTQPLYRLFDLGSYPGLVEWPDGLGICGEVYQVDLDCLRRLDEAEGVYERLYARRRIYLQTEFEGRDVYAWFWLRTTAGLRDCSVAWP